ncbi:MAG TPA: hypothetical protein VMZ53_19090 [Kofleriaceae bacterium]|nr:hypothetical protein [Kofleriaceae bacterium]
MAQFTGGPSVRVSANNSVEFKWLTDVAWFGKVEIFTTSDGNGAPVLIKNSEDAGGNPIKATQQIVTLPVGPALQQDTGYFFRITATDPTLANADLVASAPLPPLFCGNQMVSTVSATPTTNSATVAWQSNVPGFGKVAYGTNGLTQSVQDGFNICAHALDLPALQPGTTYKFQVSNRHAIDGDDLVTAQGQFTTAAVSQSVVFTEPHAEPRVIQEKQTSAVSIRTKNQGAVVAGVQVTFAIAAGSAGAGTLSVTQATTDANGIATVQFTGTSRGLVKVAVSAANASNSPHEIPVVVK